MVDLVTNVVAPPEPGRLTDQKLARAQIARTAADRHASSAGVTIRQLHEAAEVAPLCELFREIWQEEPNDPSVGPVILHALAHTGNYVSGAYAGGALVGACVGFFSTLGGWELHSHIAGVAAQAQARSVGFALKTHQRAWALARGIDRVSWTFDPLVRRNAYFNLAKLGARPRRYLTNFYGEMRDAINGGDETDRIEAEWSLDDPSVARACTGQRLEPDLPALRDAGCAVALSADRLGGPVVGTRDAPVLLVAVPPDVERLRVADRAAATDWRLAVRAVLGGLMAENAAVTGFARDGWYVVSRESQ